MTPLEVVLVAAAGAAGALLRHELTVRADPVRTTAVVNVAGSAALGAATVALTPGALLVAGGGFLGALTTFSTWMVQADDHPHRWRVVGVPLLLGVVAAALGRVAAAGVVA